PSAGGGAGGAPPDPRAQRGGARRSPDGEGPGDARPIHRGSATRLHPPHAAGDPHPRTGERREPWRVASPASPVDAAPRTDDAPGGPSALSTGRIIRSR